MELSVIESALVTAAAGAKVVDEPFRHWCFRRLLPEPVAQALVEFSPAPPLMITTGGRRETNNATRRFLNAASRSESEVCRELAAAFQSPPVVHGWQRLCGVSLAGSYLRIEYCQDMGGFWLEPHTDIGAKLFTLLIYLVDPPPGECWGTDLLHPDGTLAERTSGNANSAVLFIPAQDSWHGFAPRPITGVRRTLIVNYVVPAWRSRHELSFPDRPVRAADA
jgi:hypothetical protein